MKALASASAAMWSATDLLWARIRAFKASIALAVLLSRTTILPPRSRLRMEKGDSTFPMA